MQPATRTPQHEAGLSGTRILLALLAYVCLLFYGSLYPFSVWHSPDTPLLQFLPVWPARLSKADLMQNVLVYAPFGLLCTLWLAHTRSAARAVLLAVTLGAMLSLVIECLQQFNPARVPSSVDIAMNTLGAAGGALLATTIVRHTVPGAIILAWRDRWFRPGALANTGLVVLGFWMLSQTSPLVPSLDIGYWRHALSGLWRALHDPYGVDLARLARYTCLSAGLGVMVLLLGRPAKPVMLLFAAALGAVLLAKIVVISRVLSLEAICGSALAFVACLVLRHLPARLLPALGIGLVAAGFTISQMMSGSGGGIGAPFNWIPFAGHMRSFTALENILELLWPFMALAWFVRWGAPAKTSGLRIVTGAMLVGGAVLALEWQQQWTPGRYGDITQVMLCMVGWMIPWCVRDAGNEH